MPTSAALPVTPRISLQALHPLLRQTIDYVCNYRCAASAHTACSLSGLFNQSAPAQLWVHLCGGMRLWRYDSRVTLFAAMSHSFTPFCIDVPATSANLGPGFDSFGLALSLYNRFCITPSPSYKVHISGYGDDELNHTESNLVFGIYRQVCRNQGWKEIPFALNNHNDIPSYGGIGSSATAIVAGISIAAQLHGANWDKHQLLHKAFGFENHLDNIAAAVFGGFVVTSFYDHISPSPLVLQKTIDTPLCAWLVVPHLRVATSASRIAMPTEISYSDSVFNLAHAAQLALAFERQDWSLVGRCMQDKIHQPYRQESCAGLLQLDSQLRQAGAYGMALSGSGPAVVVLCDAPTQAMEDLIAQHMQHREIDYTQLALSVDNTGVRYH